MARRALLFAALLAWCGALLFVRFWRSHTVVYAFLIWNLFLAVIPAVAAAFIVRTRAPLARIVWAAVWLLFLPNAPYITTDFLHLMPRPPIPLWFDLALLLSCAGTGLLLGYSSVADVHGVVRARFGSAAGWIVALGALILSGFGIYLGRFLRWNSWDPIANPDILFARLRAYGLNPMSHPRTIAVTVIFGAGLAIGYIALRVFARTTR